jgi:hypothetical protein
VRGEIPYSCAIWAIFGFSSSWTAAHASIMRDLEDLGGLGIMGGRYRLEMVVVGDQIKLAIAV